MSATTDILRASLEKLLVFNYSPQPDIMWPGISSDPPQQGMWLKIDFFPNRPENIAWSNDACVDTRGFIQIMVYFRPGDGVVDPTVLADAICEFFPKGLELGPVRVRKRAYQKLAVKDDASKLYIPITIPYLGLT